MRNMRKPYKTPEEDMIGCNTLTIHLIQKFVVCILSGS